MRAPPDAAARQTRVNRRLWTSAAGCSAAFALLALLVRTAWTSGVPFDERWSTKAFTFTLGHHWSQVLARAATWTGSTSTLAVLTACVVLACALARRFSLGAWLAVTVAGSALLNTIVKAAMARTRPPTVGGLASADGFAFPSGHAQGAVATYTAIVLVVGWQIWQPGRRGRVTSATAVTLLVAAVGFSRVLLGVHWPTDVVGGWLLGSAWVLAATAVLHGWLLPRSAATAPALMG